MTFDDQYYDRDYFASEQGKQFRRSDGTVGTWGYRNPDGHWCGCSTIANAWKKLFGLGRCNTDTGLCKVLDVGCGRGQFTVALRDIGVECWGFDWSKWAIDNRYKGCQEGWIIQWDATDKRGWPYGNNAFDLVLVLDFFEHIYSEDIDFVINDMYRISKKWIFIQVATVGGGSGSGTHEKGYFINKGEQIPVELEGYTVAGHVTVSTEDFWVQRLKRDGWELRKDLVTEFCKIVPHDIIANWIKNTMLILEKVK